MRFTLAQYGSFADTLGYCWKIPVKLPKENFEKVIKLFTKHYSDGRLIHHEDLFGGYYIDPFEDSFYAFRFVDGGQDALGRQGVVITNWAVSRYSDVCGKNIEPLFKKLFFTKLPQEKLLDIDFLNIFTNNSSEFFTQDAKTISGEQAKIIFSLPNNNVNGIIFVQFAFNNFEKTAQLVVIQKPKNQPKNLSPQISLIRPLLSPRFLAGITISFFGVFLIICISWNSPSKKQKNTILRGSQTGTSAEEPENPPSVKPAPDKSNSFNSTDDEKKVTSYSIFDSNFEVWTPFCKWVLSLENKPIKSADFSYNWGKLELRTDNIRINFFNDMQLKEQIKNEYGIYKDSEKIGRVERAADSLKIVFPREENNQQSCTILIEKNNIFDKIQKKINAPVKNKYPLVFDLHDQDNQDSAILTITDSFIEFKVLRK